MTDIINKRYEKEMLTDTGREIIADKAFPQDTHNQSFENTLFVRLVAIDKTFSNVTFKYCTFDQAYLRGCKFIKCDFTGARFLNCNLSGSKFDGCKFNYSQFEKTMVENDILQTGCPSYDNLKLKFARTLRMNFQQLGDAESVNMAIGIELEATESHLYKSWMGKESYYRKKYKGYKRIKAFFKWLEFRILDLIWGNGESAWKLLRSFFIVLLIIGLVEWIQLKPTDPINLYVNSMLKSPQILFGIAIPKYSNEFYLTVVYLVRLILFGFFMSIIIKRFNRR